MTKEIISACSRCCLLRSDPWERFHLPPEPVAPDARFYWYGECPSCGRPTKQQILGPRVAAVVREGE